MRVSRSWVVITLFVLLAGLVGPVAGTPAAAAVGDPVGTWPLRPEPDVVAPFDPPDSTWGAGHRGVDLAGQVGQPVRAALPGTVSFVGRVAGRSVVVVDHGATRTTYEPVTATRRRGSPVTAGAVIGTLDLVASHCFPRACLHWGWLRGDTYLDPLRLVGAGPVRLLPLDGLPDTGTPALATASWRPGPPLLAGFGLGPSVSGGCPWWAGPDQARGWACR